MQTDELVNLSHDLVWASYQDEEEIPLVAYTIAKKILTMAFMNMQTWWFVMRRRLMPKNLPIRQVKKGEGYNAAFKTIKKNIIFHSKTKKVFEPQ